MKLSFRGLRLSLKQRTLLLLELYSGSGSEIKEKYKINKRLGEQVQSQYTKEELQKRPDKLSNNYNRYEEKRKRRPGKNSQDSSTVRPRKYLLYLVQA